MDKLITGRLGMNVSEIVKRYGWLKFREIECEVAAEVARMSNVINDTGGGVVTINQNVEGLKNTGMLVWLRSGVASILKRIGEDDTRPPLTENRTQLEEIDHGVNAKTSEMA